MFATRRSERERKFHFPQGNRWIALGALVTVAGFGLIRPANAIPIAGTPLDVAWTVDHNPVADLYEYRYQITNTGAVPIVDGVRWTVAEDQLRGHAGLHDEPPLSFMNDAGVFAYDGVKAGFPVHTYDWTDLDIPAGATIVVGFDDAHGPTTEKWGIEFGAFGAVRVSPGAPVPGLPVGTISLNLDPAGFPNGPANPVKAYTVEGGVAEPVAGGFNYKYFLRNTGNVPFGPPPPTNHADFYLNEHPTHTVPPHHGHEVFNRADNAVAGDGFGNDSAGHVFDGEPLPGGIGLHNYYWEGLGRGAAWIPGQLLTLGFFDPDGPGMAAWGGIIRGSYEEGYFDSPAQLVPTPSVPEPSPLSLLGLALAGLYAARKRQHRLAA